MYMHSECLCPACCDRAAEAQKNDPRARAAFFRELVSLGLVSPKVNDGLRDLLSRCGDRIEELQDKETERALSTLATSLQEDLCEGREERLLDQIERAIRTLARGEPS